MKKLNLKVSLGYELEKLKGLTREKIRTTQKSNLKYFWKNHFKNSEEFFRHSYELIDFSKTQ